LISSAESFDDNDESQEIEGSSAGDAIEFLQQVNVTDRQSKKKSMRIGFLKT